MSHMEAKTKEVLESCEKLHEKVLELVHKGSGQKQLRECTTCRCSINRIFAVCVVFVQLPWTC